MGQRLSISKTLIDEINISGLEVSSFESNNNNATVGNNNPSFSSSSLNGPTNNNDLLLEMYNNFSAKEIQDRISQKLFKHLYVNMQLQSNNEGHYHHNSTNSNNNRLGKRQEWISEIFYYKDFADIFMKQLSSKEELKESFLNINWNATISLIERSLSTSMNFIGSKEIGNLFDVVVDDNEENNQNNSKEQQEEENKKKESDYYQVKLVVLPELDSLPSFTELSFPVIDKFQTLKEVSSVKFELALVIGPFLLYFDKETNLIIPKKTYGMAKDIIDQLPFLFVTKQKDIIIDKIAECVVKWNILYCHRGSGEENQGKAEFVNTDQRRYKFGNSLEFVDDFLKNYLRIDYLTFPIVSYIKTFIERLKCQSSSELIFDTNQQFLQRYEKCIVPVMKERISIGDNSQMIITFKTHSELDDFIKALLKHDVLDNNLITLKQQNENESSGGNSSNNNLNIQVLFFGEILRIFDRAMWLYFLFGEDLEECCCPQRKKSHHHHSTENNSPNKNLTEKTEIQVVDYTDDTLEKTKHTSSPHNNNNTSDHSHFLEIMGCAFGNPIRVDYTNYFEKNKKKARKIKQVLTRQQY
ncbi:hypothetical protein ABK040_003261 [Willaertia magna]